MSAYPHPHTIGDGEGSRLTFERLGSDERGEYLAVTNDVRPGAGPPMHIHHLQEESLTVVSGALSYEVLGSRKARSGRASPRLSRPASPTASGTAATTSAARASSGRTTSSTS